MDEEDGRPGPGARQSGPDDVLTDALVSSLCRPSAFLTKMPISRLHQRSPIGAEHPSGAKAQSFIRFLRHG